MVGLQVTVVSNGIDSLVAVDQLEKSNEHYDVILMDWQMPIMDGVTCAQLIRQRDRHRHVSTIMITAAGAEDAQHSATEQAVEFSAVLSKPVTASTLLETLGDLLGAARTQRKPEAAREEVSRRVLDRLAGSRVLLVEDNELNQELAVALLAQAAVTVVVAGNGQIALDVLALDQQFDCILMDCQMPVMDGYTATQHIKTNPLTQSIAVIAMTASAMIGDKEKALAAGMQDYITKPLNVSAMFVTMARWIGVATAEPAVEPLALHTGTQPGLPDLPGVNVQAGLAICMNNLSLYIKLLCLFRDQSKDFVAQFTATLNQDDAVALVRLAHTLKGTAANIAATDVQAAAAALQVACEQNLPRTAIDGCLSKVAEALAPIIEGLSELRG